jgi:hypothetical protein
MEFSLKYEANKKVFIILVATEYRISLHNLIENIKKQGYSYYISQFQKPWKGWKTKWVGFMEACKVIEKEYGDDVVCVAMDAYDTAVIRSAEEFLVEYTEYKKQFPEMILCGLEHLCHPKNCGYIEPYWENNNINSSILQKKYVNAGCVIGNPIHLFKMYEWMLFMSKEKDDQKALAQYINTHSSMVEMDMNSKFIKNKKFGESLSPFELSKKGSFFLHYPGPSSYTMEHTKTLQLFGSPFVFKTPDYHYLAKKFYAGFLEHKFLVYCIVLFFMLFFI